MDEKQFVNTLAELWGACSQFLAELAVAERDGVDLDHLGADARGYQMALDDLTQAPAVQRIAELVRQAHAGAVKQCDAPDIRDRLPPGAVAELKRDLRSDRPHPFPCWCAACASWERSHAGTFGPSVRRPFWFERRRPGPGPLTPGQSS